MTDPVPSIFANSTGRRVIDMLDEGIVVQDAHGVVRDWNAAALRMLRVSSEQLAGREPLASAWYLSWDSAPATNPGGDGLRTLLARTLEHGTRTIGVHTGEEPTTWIAVASYVVREGDDDRTVSTMNDVTAQRETERENAHYREIIDVLDASYRILEESPIGMCSVAPNGDVLRSNMAFLALGGADVTSIFTLVPDDDAATLRDAFELLIEGRMPSVRIETRVRRPTDAETWCEMTAVAMRQGKPDAAILLIINDVTERRRRELRLRQLAERDPLTGLHNRRSFVNALRERLSSLNHRPTRRSGGDWMLLLIDLDGFKDVNDTCGHAGGDAVLVAVAAGIRDRTRVDDVVGRLGGDEFAVLFRSREAHDASSVGEQIVQRVAQAAQSVEGAPPVTASIGVVRLAPGARAEDMLEAADHAMYSAKRAGKARVVQAAS